MRVCVLGFSVTIAQSSQSDRDDGTCANPSLYFDGISYGAVLMYEEADSTGPPTYLG
jgi:hypothetical protein